MQDSTPQADETRREIAARSKARSYYWRNREKILARLRQKYRQDERYREAVRERSRRRYHEDEAYREATKRRSRERYQRVKQVRMLLQAVEAKGPLSGTSVERGSESGSEE